MNDVDQVTGYEDVDQVLRWFLARARATLDAEFVGMYLYGSLALGDFDPAHSDIDFLVVTERELPSTLIDALREIHARFDGSASPWSGRIEAAYVERAALRSFPPGDKAYPQVEKDRDFFVEPLEMGWIFQCFTLRHYGVTLTGPAPGELIPPLDPDEMRRAAAPVALMWQREAREDPSWLPRLRERPSLAFVVLTLCRLLYTLDCADVASKPAAARWALRSLDERWSPLIARALADQHAPGQVEPWEEREALALIDYTIACFRERLSHVE